MQNDAINPSMTSTVGNEGVTFGDLPESLQYGNILPRGFASSYKIWRVNPQTSYQVYNTTDIVRFVFETRDYIDPYNSYLEVEVEFDPANYLQQITTPVVPSPSTVMSPGDCPIFMLDGPATSLIDSLLIYSNSREIERVQAYDHVGYLMQDLGIKLHNRLFKPHEGNQLLRPLTNDNSAYIAPIANPGGDNDWFTCSTTAGSIVDYTTMASSWQGTSNQTITAHGATYYHPGSKLRMLTGSGIVFSSASQSANGSSQTFGASVLGPYLKSFYKFPISFTFNSVISQTTGNAIWSQTNGYMNDCSYTFRKSYTMEFALMDGSCGIQGSSTPSSGVWGNLLDVPNGSGGSYMTQVTNRINVNADQVVNNMNSVDTSRNNARSNGYIRPYSAGSSYNISAYFAPHIIKHTIFNGVFFNWNQISQKRQTTFGFQPAAFDLAPTTLRFYETRKTFYVPILSGALGTLIPTSAWKLLPGAGCGQLLFEWRFNPYAFFTSGPNYQTFDSYNNNTRKGVFNPARDQWPIIYRFTKLEMVFELWNFGERVDQILNQRFASGMLLTSRMITQGPTYAVASSAQAMNSWQVNNGIPSLRNIYFYFLSTEYQNYNWCRKHYRLSRNITSIQLKMGQNYIPQTGPVRGHSGQLYKNSQIMYDYLPFYTMLQTVRGNLFSLGRYPDDDTCDPNITPEQFVVDQRPYTPTNIEDVCCGQALFHETRCRGQALYCVNLLQDPFDTKVLTGQNTLQYRPFEIRIETAADVIASPTPSTMYIMLEHDFIVQFTAEGIKTAGQG